MSGTSLDGLDIAHCTFSRNTETWDYSISKAVTVSYPPDLLDKLKNAGTLSGEELSLFHVDLGVFFGESVKRFMDENRLKVDFVSSHGHTVFHQPERSFTLQIASPAHIAAITGCKVVADFRTGDVARGGHGAPLVPIGDELLFAEFDVCLNLGGIANLSFSENGKRVAFDVCPFNMLFNWLSAQLGHAFDEDGKLTASGRVDTALLTALNSLAYYEQSGPKSLGWEWVKDQVLPVLENSRIPVENKLATCCAHAVHQLSRSIPVGIKKVLLTGGGAYHRFFVAELKKAFVDVEIVVPSDEIIQYKEALIFAFLGLLRWEEQINCLSSVTGAKTNSISGAIYL